MGHDCCVWNWLKVTSLLVILVSLLISGLRICSGVLFWVQESRTYAEGRLAIYILARAWKTEGF